MKSGVSLSVSRISPVVGSSLKVSVSQHRCDGPFTDSQGNRGYVVQPSISDLILLQSSKNGECGKRIPGSHHFLSLDASHGKVVGAKRGSVVRGLHLLSEPELIITPHSLSAVSSNTTALAALASAPRTLTPGVFYQSYNLRVFSTPVATAVTLVGQIYMLIIRIAAQALSRTRALTLALSLFSLFPTFG